MVSMLAGPIDIFDSGRTAVFADDQGTPFAVWQPNQHIGAGRVNDVGCFCWNELASNDIEATKAFYRAVFGWEPSRTSSEGTTFCIDGRIICGAHPAGEGEPPFWCDLVHRRGLRRRHRPRHLHGGAVLMAPSDMGFGRGSMVAAPGWCRLRRGRDGRPRRVARGRRGRRSAGTRRVTTTCRRDARPGLPRRPAARRCSDARPGGDPRRVERRPKGC